jgi:RND family efflux transporter MFP subunit
VKQEALAIAEQRLADTVVKAPAPTAAGQDFRRARFVVSHRSVTEGGYVHAGAELYRLAIDNALKLRVPVPESQSGDVRNGQSVQVSIAASSHSFAGAVTRINPAVDPATHTFEVEVQIPNSDGLLQVGGLATAAILTHVDRDAATVPSDAPLTTEGVTKLLLSDGEHIESVAVTLGAKNPDWVEVLHPALPRGACVVTSGQLAFVAGGVRR